MPVERSDSPSYRRWVARAVCAVLALASVTAGRCQQFTFSAYDEGSGLSNLNATTLFQDHAGVIWAGTQSGVFTADGSRFDKNMTFAAKGFEHIRAIREDSAGRIWIADGRRLGFWQNGTVHMIDGLKMHLFSHDALDLVLLPNQHDGVYLLRSGELLLISSSNGGLSWQVSSAFSSKLLTTYPDLKTITSAAANGQSGLWVGCGHALCSVDLLHDSVTRYEQRLGVPSDVWTALRLTRSGELWARGGKNVVTHAAHSDGFERVSNLPQDCFQNLRFALLVEDPAGRMILNLANGIAVGNRSGWRVFGTANGLPEDEIDTIMADRSGALWLTSLGHGILRWQGYGDWEGWNKAAGLRSNIVWGLTRDASKHLWIATDAGLDKLDISSGSVSAEGFSDQRVFSIVVDPRQHIWIDDATGRVVDLDPKTGRSRIAADSFEHIFQMRIDRQQRIWICSRKGLFFFSPADNWSHAHSMDGVTGQGGYAWSVSEAKDGTLWIGSGKGLFRLRGNSLSKISLPFAEANDYNRMVAPAPDGTIWVQSKLPFPVLHLKVNGDVATIIDQVSGSTITSDNTTFLETDHRGWLWVGSDDGVRVFDGHTWVLCTAEDGLLWNDTDFHAFTEDPDGSVWIGTSAGVSHLIHPENLFDHPSPEMQLADVAMSGQPIPADSPEFDLRRPTFSFRFRNVNYDRGTGVIAQYKLDGEENEWQETSGGLIRFPALAAGKYNLRIHAYDQRRHTSSSEVAIPFTVLEPWWKRRWFLAAEAIAAALLVLGLWRLSIRLLVARQQELERLVAIRTKELEQEKSELLHARSELLEITRKDGLTGLLNRSTIFEYLGAMCERTKAGGPPVGIIMADLDSFKRINDNHGHLMGDAVLCECARRIRSITREQDAVGRYGGEELLIVMTGHNPGSLKPRIEALRLAIADTPICQGELALNITCSFGVTWFYGDDTTLETLLSVADSALYLAKKNGRNRVEYADSPLNEHDENSFLERSARITA